MSATERLHTAKAQDREAKRAPGSVIAERYRLESAIGKGGMGQVWAARDLRTFRRVAIKLASFSHTKPEAARARFRREAELAARMRGPAFVEVLDHGEAGDDAYMVMELLAGESLEQRLKRVGRVDLEATLELVSALSNALEVAHAQRIVHRDLKPANVFFARPVSNQSGVFALADGGEVVKVLDFGIAKDGDAQTNLTNHDVVLGSAHYMSPEQVRAARDVDGRADVWSLAVIAFRMLTGEVPFHGEGMEALVRVVSEAPRRATTILPTLPAAIDSFFKKALEKDPARRYQSAQDLAAALRRVAASPEASLFEPTRETIPIPIDAGPMSGRPTVIEQLPIARVPTAPVFGPPPVVPLIVRPPPELAAKLAPPRAKPRSYRWEVAVVLLVSVLAVLLYLFTR